MQDADLKEILAMALAAAPSHAGDDIRGGPLRTAKERLGGKVSDEQHVDNCKVPPDLRGPKRGPERGGPSEFQSQLRRGGYAVRA
jgi:hypothetical protein